jgi:tRNA(Met) C34 N-acetyltransferase TmcA
MNTLKFPSMPINFELLDASLRTALGNLYQGMTQSNSALVVHVLGDALRLQALVEQTLRDHNPNDKTTDQRKQTQQKERLEKFRKRYPTPIDTEEIPALDPKQLSDRLAWLETEIRDIRGL